jgi:hypothetical protein
MMLAVMSAASLLFIDIYYVVKLVIRKVYLLDGILEAGF